MGRLLLRRLCWRNLNTERSRKQAGVLLSVRVQHVCVCVCARLTHGAAWASVGWGSVVWSCHSELCGSGESRCRSLRRRAWTEACWCPGLEYTTKQSHTQFEMLSRCTQKTVSQFLSSPHSEHEESWSHMHHNLNVKKGHFFVNNSLQLKSKVSVAESAKCWLFYQVRGVIQNACYCLFSTDLNKILHIKDV